MKGAAAHNGAAGLGTRKQEKRFYERKAGQTDPRCSPLYVTPVSLGARPRSL